MAESTVGVNPGTDVGAIDVATDEILGIHHPFFKVEFGVDGVATPVSEINPLPVNPNIETTAFGETAIAELTPTIQIQYPFNINPAILHDHSNGGSVTIENSMSKASTGAATNQSGALRTIESIQYRPGQGTLNRFTAIFTTGVAGSTQEIGIGNTSDGFFFGYDEANFGILHRTGGSVEIRTLTITTASSTAENVTITLDGIAKIDVAVTASGNISTTAHEISDADYSLIGDGWEAHSDGDGTVRFISYNSEPKAGSYSLSSATTAVGTFAQTIVGVAPTDTWIVQADWNGDIADGSSVLPLIDFTKGNVFEIRYQWLGFGPAYFYIEEPSTGKYILVHTIQYANANVVPSIQNPTLPLSFKVANTTNATDIILRCGSMAAFVEGKVENTHFHRGADEDYSVTGATETPVLSIHNKEVFQGKRNVIKIRLILYVANAESNKQSTMRVRKGADLIGAVWSDIDANVSVVEADTSATSFTNGNKQLAMGLGKSDSINLDLEAKSYFLYPGETFTITQVTQTAIVVEGTVSINWEELH